MSITSAEALFSVFAEIAEYAAEAADLVEEARAARIRAFATRVRIVEASRPVPSKRIDSWVLVDGVLVAALRAEDVVDWCVRLVVANTATARIMVGGDDYKDKGEGFRVLNMRAAEFRTGFDATGRSYGPTLPSGGTPYVIARGGRLVDSYELPPTLRLVSLGDVVELVKSDGAELGAFRVVRASNSNVKFEPAA